MRRVRDLEGGGAGGKKEPRRWIEREKKEGVKCERVREKEKGGCVRRNERRRRRRGGCVRDVESAISHQW